MGPCNPCKRSIETTSKTIRVVHFDGFLEEYDAPIRVEEIIGTIPTHFMTTPVQLMHGMTLLKLDTLLEPGRVYFKLPYYILRLNDSPKDLICLAKKLARIAKSHRPKPKPKPKPVPLASQQQPVSSQGSNPCPSDQCSKDLISLANKFRSIAKAYWSKPKPRPAHSARPQERGLRQGPEPPPIEEKSNSTKMISWKPLLSTIREISFN
ncbi:hypothetical protein L2E82_38788 [Cichorium intybus]|uniref:Uncharacterized protein n=1 Tax=Cichorium intybus TaxID=13427 RepID=A0ACB9AH81_CICIN|nr:hypothetical protein L2E82_38788 [Cichorium intybus]